MHLSWLDPHKERRFTVVGSKRMATFDDMEPERKLTVYDKGFDENGTGGWGEYVARSGDIYSPPVPNAEPLRLECEHFIECVRSGATPRRTATAGCAWCACSRASSRPSNVPRAWPRRKSVSSAADQRGRRT